MADIPLVRQVPAWNRHERLVHGYTDRTLGNLSFRSASPDEALARRRQLAAELGVSGERLFSIPLGHTNRVAVLRDMSFFDHVDHRGYLDPAPVETREWPRIVDGLEPEKLDSPNYADGVVFDTPGVFSLIITADCAPVSFYDPRQKACGNAHIGLVGAINELPRAMIDAMQKAFGSDPSDIEVVIYPCIRKCHYDINQSRTWQSIKDEVFTAYGHDNPHYASGYFDLSGFVVTQLRRSGIQEGRISDSGICTACEYERFFSHVGAATPQAQAREGRFGAIIGMRE